MGTLMALALAWHGMMSLMMACMRSDAIDMYAHYMTA